MCAAVRKYRKHLTYKFMYSGAMRWYERLFLAIFGYHGSRNDW
jgi:hypothetical protein